MVLPRSDLKPGYRCPYCHGGFHHPVPYPSGGKGCPWCFQKLSEKRLAQAQAYGTELPIWSGGLLPPLKKGRKRFPKPSPRPIDLVVPPAQQPKRVKSTVKAQRRRERIYDRDGWACVFCGTSESLTLDHIVPRSRGGTDRLDNLQTACRRCNGLKAAYIEGEPGFPVKRLEARRRHVVSEGIALEPRHGKGSQVAADAPSEATPVALDKGGRSS
jgi:hypothetical protein